MKHEFKVGDTVLPQKHDGEPFFLEPMEECVNKSGLITHIDEDGSVKVHNWWWPLSALIPARPFVKGEEIEVQDEGIEWLKRIFYAYDPELQHPYLAYPQHGCVGGWKHARPIPKPKQITRADIATWVGTDNFIIVD